MANIYNMAEEGEKEIVKESVEEKYPVGTKIKFKTHLGIENGTVFRIDNNNINDKSYLVKCENCVENVYYTKVSESNIISILTGGRKKSHRRKQKSRKHKSRRNVNKRGLNR
jgi:hypothetical protein